MYYPEKGISYLETGVPKNLTVNTLNREVRECMNATMNAPECQYSAENCGTVATHICHAHMVICVVCRYCSKKSWSGHTWGDHFKANHPGITRDDH